MSKKDQQPDDVADDAHGVTESQQDRKHDDAAKQRPGQEDLKVHDEQSRGNPPAFSGRQKWS